RDVHSLPTRRSSDLPWVERDRHLASYPQRRRSRTAQLTGQEINGNRMKRGLRALEGETPVDQLGVWWQVGEPIEIVSGESTGRRAQPVGQRLSAHGITLYMGNVSGHDSV